MQTLGISVTKRHLLLFSALLIGNLALAENMIEVNGLYTSQDGRVRGHKFLIEISINEDGSLTGEMETWIGVYLTNGTEKVRFYKQKFHGLWEIENNTIQLKNLDVVIPASAVLESRNKMKVIVVQ
jgi:hypothetical protein